MNYKGKRTKRRNGTDLLISIGLILLLASLIICAVNIVMNLICNYMVQQRINEKLEPKTIYHIEAQAIPASYEVPFSFVELEPNPDPTLDYDWEYILCMVAAEIQTGSKENQMALAQCVRNTSERDGRSIGQVLQEDYSAKPCDPSMVSDSIKDTCYRIFVLHETVIPTNVEVMYSTAGGFYSTWHEQQQFELQIEGIKYFSYPIYNAA